MKENTDIETGVADAVIPSTDSVISSTDAVIPSTDAVIPSEVEESSPEDSSSASKKKKKSVVKIVFTSIGLAVVAFLFFVVATLAVDKFIRKSPVPSFFGYSTLIVTTGSMSGTIEEGDMIVIKKADEYKIGDIITFLPEGETTPTTHRIIRISDGKYYTRGDANNAEDTRPITEDKIVGKVINTFSHVGLFFTWLTDDFGWMYIVVAICIIVAGVLLLKYVSSSDKKESK